MNDKPEKVKGKKKSLVPAVRREERLVPLDPFAAYLQEAKRYPILSEEEEKELAIRLTETGDVDAAYQLTTANLMLVVKIAMTFKREWQNVMDLVQEGNIGLMKAVKNFDPFRGVRLSAYATWWIKSYILKYILDNWRLVRVGTTNSRRKLLFNLKKEKERLEREGFDPSTKLLAEHFGVDENEIIDVATSMISFSSTPKCSASNLVEGSNPSRSNRSFSFFRLNNSFRREFVVPTRTNRQLSKIYFNI